MGKLSKEMRQRIEVAHGKEIRCSKDCEALAMAIEERTGEHLGVSTLKRMFGFVSEQVEPRGSTMDIIARFLGYDDMKDMSRQLGDASDISDYSFVNECVSADLKPGSKVRFTYDPKRLIEMTYIGDNIYIIDEAQNSKLQKGDRVKITHLVEGYELLVSEVVSDNRNLGPYQCAKDGGLTSLEVTE